MGNTETSGPKGKIFTSGSVEIKTDHNLYYAGETINGTVRLVLTQPFPDSSFIIQFKGVEKARIVSNKTRNPVQVNDKQILIARQIVIKSPEAEKFPVGEYSYPFSFHIDEQLPWAFEREFHTPEQSTFAKIVYKVGAGLFRRPSNTFLVKKSKLKVTCFRPLVEPKVEFSEKIKLKGAVSLLLSNTIDLSIKLRDNRFYAGDQIEIIVGIDATNAKNSISSVFLELVNILKVDVSGTQTTHVQSVCKKEISQKVEKGKNYTGNEAIRVLFPSDFTRNLSESISSKTTENFYELRLIIPPQNGFMEKVMDKMFDHPSELKAKIQIFRKRTDNPNVVVVQHHQVAQMNQFPSQKTPGGPMPYPPQSGYGYPAPVYPTQVPCPPMNTQYPPNTDSIYPPNPGNTQNIDAPNGITQPNDFRVNYPSLDDEQFK
jgi:hypothetical protein